MKSKFLFLLLLSIFCSYKVSAQVLSSVYGKVINDSDHTPLPGVSIILYTADSTGQYVATTGTNGVFALFNVPSGKYKLQTSFIGFQSITTNINISGTTVNAGAFKLKWLTTTMGTAVVVGKVIPVEQKGDTTQFNADAYKTHPDATTEDLVNKMPGLSSQNGAVTVNGENVAQVLVDGEPFFGNDPTIALKNLPAEIVDKIQVFDKLSDQAQFTGFDDGNSQKTINIVTKKNRRNGTFGKGYAGYGTDGRYLAGGNLNQFDGISRFSILGLANNVNQQNFASEDILGALGGGGGGGGGGRGGQGRGGSGGGGGMGGGGGSGSGTGYSSGANNFLVGQQGGITATSSVGLNYTNAWNNNKVRLTTSYFLNNANNSNNTISSTSYTTGMQNSEVLNDSSKSINSNTDQRLNGRLQWSVDSSNSIIFTFKGTIQQTYTSSQMYENTLLSDVVQSLSNNASASSNRGYDFSENLLFMHKFHKKGRTISLNLGDDINHKSTPGNLYAFNAYTMDTTILNQNYTQTTKGTTLSSSLSYTEPLDSISQLQINYTPSVVFTNTDKLTDSLIYSTPYLDTALSNKYTSTYLTQVGGLSYRLNKGKKLFLTLSANVQYSTLSSQEQYPEAGLQIQRYYTAFVPRAIFNYRFTQSKNIRLIYQTSITPPSISQLQNVVNNSNPLLLNTGNPDLVQSYTQSATIRYGATNSKQGSTFLVYLNGSLVNNYVGNSSYLPQNDTTISGVYLAKGTQLSMPVNLPGYMSGKSFITYGRAIAKLKLNVNLNGGESYTHTPALINGLTNFANNYTTTGGIVISSNISEKIDFTLSYTDNYSQVKNTLENEADDNYLSQVYAGKINLIILKGIVLNTGISQTVYTGLTQAYNQSVLLWSGSIGYKFLKQQALLLSVSAFDILNHNKSISRTVTDTYIQDSQTTVLQRYFMFNIQYNIRNYKKPKAPNASTSNTPPSIK